MPGVILLQGNKILLVLQRCCNTWGFPKGHKKKKESMYSCALRELTEETGIKNLTIQAMYIGGKNLSGTGGFYVFKMKEEDYCALKPIDTKEISEAKWIDIEEAKKLEINKAVKNYFRMHPSY